MTSRSAEGSPRFLSTKQDAGTGLVQILQAASVGKSQDANCPRNREVSVFSVNDEEPAEIPSAREKTD